MPRYWRFGSTPPVPEIPGPPGRAGEGWATRLGANGVVDLGGAAALLGYATLAYYSRGDLGEPGLGAFLALMAWVSLPWIFVFACFRGCPDDLPVRRLILWAVLFRVSGLVGVPLFEDDYFRYLWDGYRFAETGTPYGWAPAASFADASVPEAFQRILDQVNNPDVPTIYGPTTECVFALAYFLAPGSLAALQLLLIGVDVLLIRLLLGAARPAFVLLYAWCPLVVKEIAFTAHPDGLGVCLLIGAVLLRRRGLAHAAAVCLALAAGAKVFALLLVPFALARVGVRPWITFSCVLALLYLPFVLQGGTDMAGLRVFAASWEFNSALFGIVSEWLSATDAKLLIGAGLLVLGAAYWRRYSRECPGEIPRGDWIYGVFLVSVPVINPWYALWVLPFAAIYPSCWAWTAASAVLLAYVTGINLGDLDLDAFAQPGWVRPVEFGVVFAALGIDLWRRRRARRGDV